MQDRLKALAEEMFDRGIRLEDARRELERYYIERALERCDHGLAKAAAALGLHRNTLTRKLEEHRVAARRYGRGG